MSHLKIVPLDTRPAKEKRLIESTGRLLAAKGFEAVTVADISSDSGVDRKYLRDYFKDLPGVVRAFSENGEFWPTAQELLGDDADTIGKMPPHELMALFFKRYYRSLLARPMTLDIIAWESRQKNELTRVLEEVRVRTALEFFEHMEQEPPEDVDLTALVLLMAGAVHFLAQRSRINRTLGGIDLQSEEGWSRIDKTIDQVMVGVLAADE